MPRAVLRAAAGAARRAQPGPAGPRTCGDVVGSPRQAAYHHLLPPLRIAAACEAAPLLRSRDRAADGHRPAGQRSKLLGASADRRRSGLALQHWNGGRPLGGRGGWAICYCTLLHRAGGMPKVCSLAIERAAAASGRKRCAGGEREGAWARRVLRRCPLPQALAGAQAPAAGVGGSCTGASGLVAASQPQGARGWRWTATARRCGRRDPRPANGIAPAAASAALSAGERSLPDKTRAHAWSFTLYP